MPGRTTRIGSGAPLAHDVDLARRGVRAQHDAGRGRVERVPHVARRMMRRDVEQLEVVGVGLDIARAVDLEAHLGPDGDDLPQRLRRRVQPAAGQPPAREGHVDALGLKRLRQARRGFPLLPILQRRLERLLHLIGPLAQRRAFFLGDRAQPVQNPTELRRAAEVLHLPGLQPLLVRCLLQVPQPFAFQIVQAFQHQPLLPGKQMLPPSKGREPARGTTLVSPRTGTTRRRQRRAIGSQVNGWGPARTTGPGLGVHPGGSGGNFDGLPSSRGCSRAPASLANSTRLLSSVVAAMHLWPHYPAAGQGCQCRVGRNDLQAGSPPVSPGRQSAGAGVSATFGFQLTTAMLAITSTAPASKCQSVSSFRNKTPSPTPTTGNT